MTRLTLICWECGKSVTLEKPVLVAALIAEFRRMGWQVWENGKRLAARCRECRHGRS